MSQAKYKRVIKLSKVHEDRICQGDILEDVEHIEYIFGENDEVFQQNIVFPYVVVLSQDCDLLQDFMNRTEEEENQDKCLISVLVAPAYNPDLFFEGKHLSQLGLIMESHNSDSKRKIRSNQNKRYHFLSFNPEDELIDLVIDFKHYFTVNIEWLRKKKSNNYLGTIYELFREDLSQRFASYLSRIGLPEIKIQIG